MTLAELRQALPAARTHRLLNYAATAPLLAPSAELVARIAREGCEPMAAHFEAWLGRLEGARRSAADAVAGRPDEIAFVPNTSTGLSLAAASVRWRAGDRVLFPADEFPSNRFVWQNLAGEGVSAEEVEPEPGVELAEQLARRSLDRVRLVSMSAVSYRDGRRADVAAVARLCRERGILLCVDAVQAVGAIPVSVREWGCDFLACGGQKWLLGPVGSGFLWVAAEREGELRVPVAGWASAASAGDVEARRFAPVAGARRLEPGLPDVAAVAGLGRSLELLASAGWGAIFARVAEHNARLRAALGALGITPLHAGPAETQAGIVAFELPSDEAADRLAARCAARRVLLTHRHRQLRVAAHAVTSDEDVEAFLEVLGAGVRPPRRAARRPEASGGGSPAGRPPASGRAPFAAALVTGASRGLGEGIAEALARRGCDLVLVGRDEAALRGVAARLAAEHGVRAEAAPLDLSRPEALAAWIAAARGRLASLELLVNAAAEAEAEPFLWADPAAERRAFETNLFAPQALARAVLPGMLARGRGAVLNVVTSGARSALPLFATYAATKGALWAWSEALTRELDGTGVAVTTLVPPHMPTATQRRLGRRALAHYRLGGGAGRMASPREAGERAVRAVVEGRRTAVPVAVRLKLALNALAPGVVARAVGRAWRGPGAFAVRPWPHDGRDAARRRC